MKAILILTLLLISLFLLGEGAAAETIQLKSVHVNTIGATVPVDIVLDKMSKGIAGYDVTISLSDPAVGSITAISFPSWAILNESSPLPASMVHLRTVDLYELVNSSSSEVPLGTITLQGKKIGSTDIVVTITEINSDDGESVTPSIIPSNFTVNVSSSLTSPIIVNHTTLKLSQIPLTAINISKEKMHIAYWHTSHGSQITTGMTGLTTFAGAPYDSSNFAYTSGGTNGALDLREPSSTDLGNSGWDTETRNYLNAHTDVNVVMWSWCGQVSGSSESDINNYLSRMNQLESDYPNVKFVYMTGHLDGSGPQGNLDLRNEQIRAYARANNKILFDFADIESYDFDGIYYGNKNVTDGCNYDYNNNGVTSQSGDPALPTNGDRNWAIDWQNRHIQGTDWYSCSAAHTQPLNANQKAYAAWWLFARLGGWDGDPITQRITSRIGIFQNGAWYLDYNGNGVYNPGTDKAYGFGASGFTPVIGDWNGDEKTEIGFFVGGTWYLDYNGNGVYDLGIDRAYSFGAPGFTPLVGDWNGDGTTKIGFYVNGTWYLDYNGNGIYDSGMDKVYGFGSSGFTPIVGDWNKDGKTEIGIYINGTWYLDYNENGVYDPGIDKAYGFGAPGFIPVVGDWNGDGTTKIGFYINGTWYLDYNGNGIYDPGVDKAYGFGAPGFIPVIGDWNADGTDKIGFFVNGSWYLDFDGDGAYLSNTDKVYGFGAPGFTPLVGNWG